MSIIDDKEFYQARKCLETQSKWLTKKQGKGNKLNVAEALADDKVNILFKKIFALGFWRAMKCLPSGGIKTVDICSAKWSVKIWLKWKSQ